MASIHGINGKSGTRVGLGLSLPSELSRTPAPLPFILCQQPGRTPDFAGEQIEKNSPGTLGWNAKPSSNPQLSGTLLYQRAIARTNLTLRETTGILRGILWHQGEGDSDNLECAQLYKQNLIDLVESLRTNIDQDARGHRRVAHRQISRLLPAPCPEAATTRI